MDTKLTSYEARKPLAMELSTAKLVRIKYDPWKHIHVDILVTVIIEKKYIFKNNF